MVDILHIEQSLIFFQIAGKLTVFSLARDEAIVGKSKCHSAKGARNFLQVFKTTTLERGDHPRRKPFCNVADRSSSQVIIIITLNKILFTSAPRKKRLHLPVYLSAILLALIAANVYALLSVLTTAPPPGENEENNGGFNYRDEVIAAVVSALIVAAIVGVLREVQR